MDGVRLNITSADPVVVNRWSAAFRKEGWGVIVSDRISAPCAAAGRAELDLIEVGSGLCDAPEKLWSLIRARKAAATFVVSVMRNISNSQIVRFLESGADDFLYGDLDERIVVAKLKSHIRRLQPLLCSAASLIESRDREVLVDCARRVVRIKRPGEGCREQELTQKELEILSLLVINENKPVSRRDLLEKVWGNSAGGVYPNCVSQHIETLRKKLGPHSKRIKTVYAVGYMFT